MKSDPFAPAHDPFHIKNLKRAEAGTFAGKHADRFVELVKLHVTGHEEDANQVPQLDELERRQTLVDEFREQLATEGPDAGLPTLEDGTGHFYEWREGDRTEDSAEEPSGQPDGETSSGWHFVGSVEQPDADVPPRNGPGSDADTWRAFAARATGTELAQWATLTRTDIIATLERDGVIPGGTA